MFIVRFYSTQEQSRYAAFWRQKVDDGYTICGDTIRIDDRMVVRLQGRDAWNALRGQARAAVFDKYDIVICPDPKLRREMRESLKQHGVPFFEERSHGRRSTFVVPFGALDAIYPEVNCSAEIPAHAETTEA